ncbi:hypothetical protein ACFY12_05680 [Streptomyces sp. NPDC001339]
MAPEILRHVGAVERTALVFGALWYKKAATLLEPLPRPAGSAGSAG